MQNKIITQRSETVLETIYILIYINDAFMAMCLSHNSLISQGLLKSPGLDKYLEGYERRGHPHFWEKLFYRQGVHIRHALIHTFSSAKLWNKWELSARPSLFALIEWVDSTQNSWFQRDQTPKYYKASQLIIHPLNCIANKWEVIGSLIAAI